MTISRGTPIAVDAGGAQTGSVSVNIPGGTTLVAAFWHFYTGSTALGMASLTLGGQALTLGPNVGSTSAPGGGVGYREDPATGGSVTFAWDWGAGGARDEGGRIYLIPYSGSAGSVRFLDSDFDSDIDVVEPGPLVLTSVTGGVVDACVQSFGTPPNFAGTAGQTVTVDNASYNSEGYDVGYVNTPGASNTTVGIGNVYNYASMGAISLQESSDTAPPSFTVGPGVTPSSSGGTATGSINELGDIFYVVVADGASAPSSAQVIAGQNASGAAALASGNATATTTINSGFSGLSASTAYDAYFVARDDEGTPNVQASPTLVNFTTSAASPSGNAYYYHRNQ